MFKTTEDILAELRPVLDEYGIIRVLGALAIEATNKAEDYKSRSTNQYFFSAEESWFKGFTKMAKDLKEILRTWD